MLSHWLLSLYDDQHSISLAQVRGIAEVGDGGPGDGVNLHQQPRHPPNPGELRVHGEKAGSDLDLNEDLAGSGLFHKGSNGRLDDGLQILPRLLPTPLNHLQHGVHSVAQSQDGRFKCFQSKT